MVDCASVKNLFTGDYTSCVLRGMHPECVCANTLMIPNVLILDLKSTNLAWHL